MESIPPVYSHATEGGNERQYAPPWADLSIIGIAGSSGSGKTSVAMEIVRSLNLPWVVILVMDSFYKSLSPEDHAKAHANEYDFDCPDALDFDAMVQTLKDLKQGKKADIPVYSFSEHQRQPQTTTLYSPRVLILEGILALDPRVADLLDIKTWTFVLDAEVRKAPAGQTQASANNDKVVRDVRERGRDIDGVVKQWFNFVKPSYRKYVEPQRAISDLIIPRGIENKTAIDLVVKHIRMKLDEKSKNHSAALQKLGMIALGEELSQKVHMMSQTSQFIGINTILQNPETEQVDFVFYFDRLACMLIEKALDSASYLPIQVATPQESNYRGLNLAGTMSAIAILRGGSCLETALKRTIPDCITGRVLIQTNEGTEEPELHYLKLPPKIEEHKMVMLMDPQMASGGAALMAVRVLMDHGVDEQKIVFVTCAAGKLGLKRLTTVYPGVTVIVGRIEEEREPRWMERRYFGC